MDVLIVDNYDSSKIDGKIHAKQIDSYDKTIKRDLTVTERVEDTRWISWQDDHRGGLLQPRRQEPRKEKRKSGLRLVL